jgi:hypothetical protein
MYDIYSEILGVTVLTTNSITIALKHHVQGFKIVPNTFAAAAAFEAVI